MPSARSYSLSELVEATGFDRRTIVYYIQSGLLPKVGRRGPHTRYPDECLTRLLFIKGVRSLQAEGQLLTATLAEMRRALAARDAAGIRDLLDRGLPVEELTALFAEEPPSPPADRRRRHRLPPGRPGRGTAGAAGPTPVTGPSGERRSYGLADAGIRKRFGADKPARRRRARDSSRGNPPGPARAGPGRIPAGHRPRRHAAAAAAATAPSPKPNWASCCANSRSGRP